VTGGIDVTGFEDAAQKAKLTGQVRSFLDWLGEGRKLTQTGRIRMADARYLVEFHGTGEEVRRPGGQTARPNASDAGGLPEAREVAVSKKHLAAVHRRGRIHRHQRGATHDPAHEHRPVRADNI
jgi:hypothetical protein